MHLADNIRVPRSYSSIVAVLLLALAMTSCATLGHTAGSLIGTGPAAAETTAAVPETSAPEGEKEGPLITIGEFDPESEDFELLDPCTEIPWEVYQAVGFVEEFGEVFVDPGKSFSCSFESESSLESSAYFTVTMDKAPQTRIIDAGLLLDAEPQSYLTGVYNHWMISEEGADCSAALSTTNGRLAVSFFDRSLQDEYPSLCGVAIEYLERIHSEIGEI